MAQLKKPTIKNPELVGAMTDFKQKRNPETEKVMLDVLKDASFIAPISLNTSLDEVEPDAEGKRQLQASLLAVSNKEGEKFFPAFTDWLEFLKWKNEPDAETMVITFDQYCALLLKQKIEVKGIVINPAEANITIRREKMAQMKGVTLPEENAQKKHTITALFGTEKITNNDVIIAASRLRKESSDEARMTLFDALRKAKFVAPVFMDVPENVKPGDTVNAKAEFILINHGEDKFIPLFTSLPELQKWASVPDCKAVPMTFSNYIAMLNDPNGKAAGIVLDPFSIGLAFNKQQALAIQPQIALRSVEKFPDGMTEELTAHLKTLDDVKKAYINGVRVNGEDSFVVVVDLKEDADVPKIAESTAQVAKKYGTCVVAPINSPLGQKATEDRQPFYEV